MSLCVMFHDKKLLTTDLEADIAPDITKKGLICELYSLAAKIWNGDLGFENIFWENSVEKALEDHLPHIAVFHFLHYNHSLTLKIQRYVKDTLINAGPPKL